MNRERGTKRTRQKVLKLIAMSLTLSKGEGTLGATL